MVRVKNPLCAVCKKDIDLEELSMLEQAEALDGEYIHPNCQSNNLMSQEKREKLEAAGWVIGTVEKFLKTDEADTK